MRTTIKTLGVATALMVSFAGFSQKAFEKFENSENIGSVTINKSMMDIVAKISEHSDDEDAKDFMELVDGIDNIKVFMSEDASASKEMTQTAKTYVKRSSMESLMRVKEGGSEVDFYIKSGKNEDHVKELLMVVTGVDKKAKGADIETVLVTMTGDIDLTKLGALVNKMNLPKELEKAGEKGR